jgi:hypothetical protein
MKKLFLKFSMVAILLFGNFIFLSKQTFAQNDDKKEVRIKTVEIINGKKIVKDTTFFIDKNDDTFQWNTQRNIINIDSIMLETSIIDMRMDSIMKEKFMFITSDIEQDSLIRKKVFIHSTPDFHFDEHGNHFSFSRPPMPPSPFEGIDFETIEKVEVLKEFDEEKNDSVKVLKVTIKTKDGKTEERIIKNKQEKKVIWIDEKSDKNIKTDVDIEEKGDKKIIKITTIDADGNVNTEVKEINNSEEQKMIWIDDDSEQGTKKIKKEVKIEDEGSTKIITTIIEEDGKVKTEVKEEKTGKKKKEKKKKKN